jgi:hypothetical protein
MEIAMDSKIIPIMNGINMIRSKTLSNTRGKNTIVFIGIRINHHTTKTKLSGRRDSFSGSCDVTKRRSEVTIRTKEPAARKNGCRSTV